MLNTQPTDSLHLGEIYQLINPFSELGQKEKRTFAPHCVGQETELRDYYQKLSFTIQYIKNKPESITSIGANLHHFEDIVQTITAGSQRTYEMHELYEIKHFLYQYRVFTKNIADFAHIIPIRDINKLFSLLDIAGQNSPAFFISELYSKTYQALKTHYKQVQTDIDTALATLKTKIQAELHLQTLSDTVTISRLQQDTIQKLLSSDYFYIENENFANITLKIRTPQAVLDLQDALNTLQHNLDIEAEFIRGMLTEHINAQKDILLLALNEVAFFDLLFAKAIFAKNHQCVIPEILDSDDPLYFEAHQMWNIPIKSHLEEQNIPYQKIDIKIDHTVNVISGSNMGGKTSILRTIGQIANMVRFAYPIPAQSVALQIWDRIDLCGLGVSSDSADLSSFGAEVHTLQEVINSPQKKLLLLDEFGRGTNPTEGSALFAATLQYFTTLPDTVLIATTHYQPPDAVLPFAHFQMIGLDSGFADELSDITHMTLVEKLKIINKHMNYQPQIVTANTQIPTSALSIAEILGLERAIIEIAKRNL